MDNLNTHVPGSLYEAFASQKAKALWDRFEFVYTPKHGSWLNMAETELNVLIRQCLNCRIAEIEDDVLRFIDDPLVAFTNNQTETISGFSRFSKRCRAVSIPWIGPKYSVAYGVTWRPAENRMCLRRKRCDYYSKVNGLYSWSLHRNSNKG